LEHSFPVGRIERLPSSGRASPPEDGVAPESSCYEDSMMTTPQIDELVFPDADFPREFDIQLWAFVRLVWGEDLRGDARFRTRSWDDPSPIHFVRAAGDLLVSHVLVFPLSIEGHRGVLRVGCVGAVLTFPQFRREGHASKLMRRAAQHIRQTADVGMLFCDAVNAPFYERLDWTALPRGRALVEGEIPDGVLMILGDDLTAPDPIRLPWVW
jgi:GNAT superfamily N-acetyltransferase